MLTRAKHCEACVVQVREEQTYTPRHTARVSRLDGSADYVRTARVHLSDERVFTLRASSGERIVSGRDALAHVLGFLGSEPVAMADAARHRHATLLAELLEHRPAGATWDLEGPVEGLGFVVRGWIEALLATSAGALVISYAIDTACLLETLLHGRRGYGHAPRIVGLLDGAAASRGFSWLHESQFRKRVTEEAVGGTVVLARWPAHAARAATRAYEALHADQSVAILLERCHLSETRAHARQPALDLAHDSAFQWTDFCFDAHVMMDRAEGGRYRPWLPGQAIQELRWGVWGQPRPHDVPVSLPEELISHEVFFPDAFEFAEAIAQPVRRWSANGGVSWQR